MIALIDDLDQKKVNKKSKKKENVLGRLRQAVANLQTNLRKRRKDKVAVRQLLQLDDALLKDMGLTRFDLMSVKNGSSTFDSLVKHSILSNRDNACNTTALRK